MSTEESDSGIEPPESADELLPKRVYLAELLAIPVFFLSPAMLLIVGLGMLYDQKQLKERFRIKFGDERVLSYVLVFFLGHLGSFVYRAQRRRWIVEERGLPLVGFKQKLSEEVTVKNWLVAGWFLLQLGSFILVVVVPIGVADAVMESIALVFVLSIGANVVVGPVLSWYDCRKVREIPEVEWGYTRLLLFVVSALPFGILLYLTQRMDHVEYAALVRFWDADPEELRVPDEEKSFFEKLL